MRMLGATVTRPAVWDFVETDGRARDEQVGVQCIAGIVTFKLEDGTLLEFDEVQLQGALFEATHGSTV